MNNLKEDRLLAISDVIKTEDSRINYLKGLLRIAGSDNNKTAVEDGYIYRMAEIIGASYSEIWQVEEAQENDELTVIKFDTKQEKILFLMQALYMCWLDDDYSDSERKEIFAIGDELGIESSVLKEIEAWVKHGIEWMRTGAELIGLE